MNRMGVSVVRVAEYFFYYRPTRVVPDKKPLNGCVCIYSVGLNVFLQCADNKKLTKRMAGTTE